MRYQPFAFVAVAVTCLSAAGPLYADNSPVSGLDVTVCISEDGGPWILRARGTLRYTKSHNETVYTLQVANQTFTWRLITNVDRSTTTTSPGFLIDRLAEPRPLRFPRGPISVVDDSRGPHGQYLGVDGEIREYVRSTILSSVIGGTCPAGKPKLWRNHPVERDARKSGARPSP